MTVTKYLKHDDLNTTSDMFWDSCSDRTGGQLVHCSCGIDHYAIDSKYYYETDSFPEESDNVKHHYNCDFVMAARIDSKEYVQGCESCEKKLKRYEDFIWYERDTIRNYLKSRIDHEKQWADYEHMCNVIARIF